MRAILAGRGDEVDDEGEEGRCVGSSGSLSVSAFRRRSDIRVKNHLCLFTR